MLERVDVTEYQFNWKAFMEVYLELYHVGPFHPGLGKFVDPTVYTWKFGERWSTQEMGIYQRLTKPGSPAYGKYIDALLRYTDGRDAQVRHGVGLLLPERHAGMVSVLQDHQLGSSARTRKNA